MAALRINTNIDVNGPVVALESTLITHGLPYPQNVETALNLEQIIRGEGAAPATIAVLDGDIAVGLTGDEIDRIGKEKNIRKLNASDLAPAAALKQSGGTTVAATMCAAAQAGIQIFATGGIGGVHRGAADTMDISQDMTACARYPVAVVTAGAKAILDLPKTLEYLETLGVPVAGYGTDEFPAFWSRSSGLPLHWRIDSPADAAGIIRAQRNSGWPGGLIIANPVPADRAVDGTVIESRIEQAIAEAAGQNITGKAVTPFLLKRIRELSNDLSLPPNIALLENNARLAAQIAMALRR